MRDVGEDLMRSLLMKRASHRYLRNVVVMVVMEYQCQLLGPLECHQTAPMEPKVQEKPMDQLELKEMVSEQCD